MFQVSNGNRLYCPTYDMEEDATTYKPESHARSVLALYQLRPLSLSDSHPLR